VKYGDCAHRRRSSFWNPVIHRNGFRETCPESLRWHASPSFVMRLIDCIRRTVSASSNCRTVSRRARRPSRCTAVLIYRSYLNVNLRRRRCFPVRALSSAKINIAAISIPPHVDFAIGTRTKTKLHGEPAMPSTLRSTHCSGRSRAEVLPHPDPAARHFKNGTPASENQVDVWGHLSVVSFAVWYKCRLRTTCDTIR